MMIYFHFTSQALKNSEIKKWDQITETAVFQGQTLRLGESRLLYSNEENGRTSRAESSASSVVKNFVSTIPEIGLSRSESFAAPDSIWPWPWLHPDDRQSSDYVQSGERVTFSQQKQLPKSTVPLLAHTLKGLVLCISILGRSSMIG